MKHNVLRFVLGLSLLLVSIWPASSQQTQVLSVVSAGPVGEVGDLAQANATTRGIMSTSPCMTALHRNPDAANF